MKFKFINVTINLPDNTEVSAALEIESKIKAFVTDLGLAGSVGFDVMDDIGTTKAPSPTSAPAGAPVPTMHPTPAPTRAPGA